MKPFLRWTLIVVLILAAAAGGFFLGRRGGSAQAEPDTAPNDATGAEAKVKPVAQVRVVPVRRGSLSQTLTAYGTVASQSSDIRVLSVPFESRVTRMLATPGQEVAQDAPLMEVEPSPATRLALQEAMNTAENAQQVLDQTQQRFDQKLATNAELLTAQNDRRTAAGRLQNLQQAGVTLTGPQTLKAPAQCVISKIDVQLGQVVPAAGPLIELTAHQRVEVRLGIEPADAAYIKPGQEVRLTTPDNRLDAPVIGHIRLVAQRVSPDTRLLDAFVEVPPAARLLLDSYVVGQLVKQTAEGLIVPRAAVLPDEDANVLFSIKDGHAVQHKIQTSIQTDAETQVVDPTLQAGDPVVVEGNYELEDGMAVAVGSGTESTTAPETTTAPATTAAPAGTTAPTPSSAPTTTTAPTPTSAPTTSGSPATTPAKEPAQ